MFQLRDLDGKDRPVINGTNNSRQLGEKRKED